ncbi:MAG: glycosyltransferase [Candidatus Eremiobacteraeota bacterium]|nr:glycosyltransferase [Candidatus Eremiobacteraeota bacterium]
MIKVSALVSCYRSEAWLATRLDNLLAQELGEALEIVVVVSGSPEREADIVRDYQARHPNIRLLETPHQTVYGAWNRAIEVARGEYLTNANTDDRMQGHGLARLAGVLDDRPEVALVYPDHWVAHHPRDVVDWEAALAAGRLRRLRRPPYRHQDLLLQCWCGPNPMWRRSLHDELGLFDETYRVSGDWEFWLRVAEHHPLFHLDEPLGIYYRNPEGLELSQQATRLQEDALVRRRYYAPPTSSSHSPSP